MASGVGILGSHYFKHHILLNYKLSQAWEPHTKNHKKYFQSENQRIAKGAGGKGPRQKTSKIVKKCQKVFRQFSRRAKNVKNRQKVSKSFSTICDSFRATPFFRPGPFCNPLRKGNSQRDSQKSGVLLFSEQLSEVHLSPKPCAILEATLRATPGVGGMLQKRGVISAHLQKRGGLWAPQGLQPLVFLVDLLNVIAMKLVVLPFDHDKLGLALHVLAVLSR